MDHEIFRTPNKVELTITEQPTPTSYANYPEGRTLGKTMPMWRVQTEGYTTHPGQLVGIVSRDAGFLDSPDAEWISGGVNSKGPNAVALGRHGNFFHWGFAASPTYMTAEAKDVFVNAVHYIAGFDGQTPIARKVSGTMMRSAIDAAILSMSEEGYAKTVARYAAIREQRERQAAAIRERIEAGEEVSDMDRRIAKMPPVATPGRIDRARRLVSPEVVKQLDADPEKIASYLRRVKPYMHPTGWYTLAVDPDLEAIGIGSADISMLDKAIALLASDEEKARGQRLLTRYTAQTFSSAAEWSDWLAANRERLFFTEAAGYKWLVDTIEPKRRAVEATTPPRGESPSKSEVKVVATPSAPLAAVLTSEKHGSGRFTLTVHVDILPGWHAYDVVPTNSAYIPLELELILPDGVKRVGKWKRPGGLPSAESAGLFTFEGRLRFSCDVVATKLDAATGVSCKISYQVCDDSMCMPPAEELLKAKIKP